MPPVGIRGQSRVQEKQGRGRRRGRSGQSDQHREGKALVQQVLRPRDTSRSSADAGRGAATGEEAQLAQEKMESLRMRYLIVGQSSADTMHRLGQTLEASSRLGTAQEDLALWLGRMEKELASWDSQHGGQELLVSTSDREKVRDTGLWGPSPSAPFTAPQPRSIAACSGRRGSRVWRDVAGWDTPGYGRRSRTNQQQMQRWSVSRRGRPGVRALPAGTADGSPLCCSSSRSWTPSSPTWLGSASGWRRSAGCSWMPRPSARSSPIRRWVCSAALGWGASHRYPHPKGVPRSPQRHQVCVPTLLGSCTDPKITRAWTCQHLCRTWHPHASVFQLLSAEILHHRGLVERLLGISDPLLHSCPESLQQHLQVSSRAGAAPVGAGWDAAAAGHGRAPCPQPHGSGAPR